ncbi:ATP-binding protein [uncultured Tenacibaculum sp.]|uniref:sensor histidine kinase n=1 Tax=uncultured Tenacibaculum sp. TaxID=174713 RepID=UPI002607BA9E|nr:ATP-binding protein [uncultured Tenacibaculum sp.]
MAKYKRVKGGEKNNLSGKTFTRDELERVYELYVELEGKGIHENNPKIHALSSELGRTIRSVENQLLGFRAVDTKKTGRANYNKLIPKIWNEKKNELENLEKEKEKKLEEKRKARGDFEDFKFRISSKLKNIIGKDLITDEFIAVFELVKNSFDAHSKKVEIVFLEDKIIIKDSGKGMNKHDLINKWLFVAYSAKNEGKEDEELLKSNNSSYRDKLLLRNNYAGAKGVGRFSTDRLGAKLKLITKKVTKSSKLWQLEFSWDDFEFDAEEEFQNIDIKYNNPSSIEYKNFENGLILEISELRSVWDRKRILQLKKSLEKLINPFASFSGRSSDFDIEIICERERERDKEVREKDGFSNRDVVNGKVENFVFETLNLKTTSIKSYISDDEDYIITELNDRGNLIYEIKEENPYLHIPSGSRINLFYLNTSAKINFKHLMGVSSRGFGSVFLFNNGFRIFPVGEPGDDTFGIDSRKSQGYARYIGTRDLIGDIEIWGKTEGFRETSSRDGGLIETSGTKELETFLRLTLIKLENFVTPILWKIKKRTKKDDQKLDFDSYEQIVDLVGDLVEKDNVRVLKYHDNFLSLIDDKIDAVSPQSFLKLKLIASETKDEKLLKDVVKSEQDYYKILEEKEEEERKRKEEEERRKKAEKKRREEEERRKEAERKAKEEEEKRKVAERKAEEEEYKALKAQEEARRERARRVEEEQRRRQKESQVRFLESVNSLDIEDVLNLHHQIGIDSNTIDTLLANIKRKIDRGEEITNDKVRDFIERVSLANKKILAVSKFTTKNNFMAAARVTEDDLISFLKNYILNIYKYHLGQEINIKIIEHEDIGYVTRFKPIELTIIVDNLINNSKKMNAKNLIFEFESVDDKNTLIMNYYDDGKGFDAKIDDLNQIFDRGYTTTRGSGLGLYHVKKIIGEMKGEVKAERLDKGIKLTFKFKK